ncbi:PHP domain-containing protein [Lacticaseibacillus brantae]|uniref:Histidinol-phosphatase n=1 Tax=Lacticaseibacillus brantae DSM 23927 TaxID=1423727 RepID=A0A0R2AZW3_9LACO|nr:PHP domain-containing protein [Lacticaseibacillus brantae]KRM71300.1 hypothetical protein FC34_GL001780 [Lacticaseibacillus brantae DSM 23927]
MTYYDQHVHTYFSFDSSAEWAAYLAQTTLPVVTTEHLEFQNPDDGGHDDAPDYSAYVAEAKKLRTVFPNRILLGVEVGYRAPLADQIATYLAANDYDLTLLSFHQDGDYDYQNPYFRTVDQKAHVQAYYETMLAGVREVGYADVLAHFDYGLRVLDVTPEQLTAWAKPLLTEIFKTMIAKHIAFELNTKSMYRWENEALYATVIPWYQALGGTLFTLGSDAHTVDKYANGFDEAKHLLHQLGVHQLVTYQQHQPSPVTF